MDDQRKGDVRVYIVSVLFLSCIVSGGVFLGIYMFLPESQSSSWYPIAGMVLVSIPWAFWFFTFMYRCVRPQQAVQPNGNNPHFHKGGGGGVSTREPVAAIQTALTGDSSDCESPVARSPGGGGERRVQFGPVVVLGNQGDRDSGQREQHNRESSEVSNCSRESEVPLRSSV